MKKYKIPLQIFAILLLLSSLTITPLAWIGFTVVLIGVYQSLQNRVGNGTYKYPRIFIITGFLFSSIMAITFVQADEETEKAEERVDKEKEVASEETTVEDKEQQDLIKLYGLEEVTVSQVVDGDTVELNDGRIVRLVGVNTPESTIRTEEYGKEASKYTQDKLTGKKVWMQRDVSEKDSYHRLLRIIWLDIPTDDMDEDEIRKKMFNADLVINGYAEPSTYQPDVKYSDWFVKLAREARNKETGLWAFGKNGTTKGDLDTEVDE
ncbi:thermonuclease family protein [Bacillus spongiae]|uniref:Thermonuclease family protein n=1 Tax=Bacillus spongiae TaxID=2683610 RepID=A0ABU8HD39_9BACI